MLNDTSDLHDLLSRPLPGEPRLAEPSVRLVAGRRALRARRRRTGLATGAVATSVAAVAVLAVAAGSVSGGGDPDQVAVATQPGPATLTPTPAPEPTPSAEPAAGSSQLRVADLLSHGSPRRDRLIQAWTDCLLDAGAPTMGPDEPDAVAPDTLVSRDRGLTVASPIPDGPRAACADLEPVYPPALQAATNPTFAVQAQEYVACLREGGLFVRLLGDEGLDWTYRAGHAVPEDSVQTEDTCLMEVFGDAG